MVIWTLASRELVRFFRQRNRVIGALGQPILFWLFFGAGLASSFRLPGAGDSSASYAEYFFPGVLIMIVLFTAIFASISIIEDRREGFLQSVLVAPISTWSMVLGKVCGGSLIALLQGIVFLALGYAFLDLAMGPVSVAGVIITLAVTAISLTSLGFVIAWRMDSVQGFHAIMSLLLMPMWLLSGAFFPAGSNWLGWVIRLNPLTYSLATLRHILYWHAGDAARASALPESLPSLTMGAIVTLAFAAIIFLVACAIAAR